MQFVKKILQLYFLFSFFNDFYRFFFLYIFKSSTDEFEVVYSSFSLGNLIGDKEWGAKRAGQHWHLLAEHHGQNLGSSVSGLHKTDGREGLTHDPDGTGTGRGCVGAAAGRFAQFLDGERCLVGRRRRAPPLERKKTQSSVAGR